MMPPMFAAHTTAEFRADPTARATGYATSSAEKAGMGQELENEMSP